jgi:hypothetical protein
MTNSPHAVREFFHDNPQRMICKVFSTHIWEKEQGGPVMVTETFELSPDKLPSDEVLTFAPAIYQEMVVKKFDVRMVLLGEAVYSYSLHNPQGRARLARRRHARLSESRTPRHAAGS